MKNRKAILIKTSFILGISLFSHAVYSKTTVYLENNYGETLNYKTSSTSPEGRDIGTNVRILLGDVDSIPELWIRTTNMVASYFSSTNYLPSSYFDLKHLLNEIKSQQRQHPNDDAIIAIDKIGTKQWKTNVRWETRSKLSFDTSLTGVPKERPTGGQPFTQPAIMIEINLEQLEKEQALMATTTADGRLNHIKNGALGPDYARKATEICSAHYTQAEKLGKINLCSRLKTELIAPKLKITSGKTLQPFIVQAKNQKKEIRYVQPDLAPAIEDIKNSINRIHNALSGYKTRGEAS